MKKPSVVFITIVAMLGLMVQLHAAASETFTLANLEDQVRGGWAGQMIGVSYGAPTEFSALGKIIEGDLPAWKPERVSNAIEQDDLYVEMTFAEVMDREGLDVPSERYGEAFRVSKYGLWHANAAARRLLNLGIKAPDSGKPEFNIHANDIDFQIEADFIGLMCPGLPRAANRFCDRVGRVMNSGDGLYGGMFVAGMYAAAFIQPDPRKVVEAGLAGIPEKSGYAAVIRDVLAQHAVNPADWKACWKAIEEKWDRDDPCPDGALVPFNIDARLNGAYVAIGLLYGSRDFGKTIEIATRCGQDSDCNPSTAGGIMGVMIGWKGIPDEWKSGIPPLAGTKFQYTSYSFDDIVRSTLARAKKVIEAEGGSYASISGLTVAVPIQSPQPPPLEQWEPGVPATVVRVVDDPSCTWKGTWAKEKGSMAAGGAGAEAVYTVRGSGLAIVGVRSGEGGRADVYLDGKKMRPIETWIVENTHDNDLWHAFGFPDGKHEVRIVVRDDADPRSKGKKVVIRKAIAYRPR